MYNYVPLRSMHTRVSSSLAVLPRSRGCSASAFRLVVGMSCVLCAWAGTAVAESRAAQPRLLSDKKIIAVDGRSAASPIMDSSWTIELHAEEGGSSQVVVEDTLTFTDSLMRSSHSTAEGYQPAVYSLDRGAGGQLVWESAQHHPNGTAILWEGQLEGDRMRGTRSRQLDSGAFEVGRFVGTRVMLPSRPHDVPRVQTAAAERLPAAPSGTGQAKPSAEAKAGTARVQTGDQDAQAELMTAREQVKALSEALVSRTAERDAALADKAQVATRIAAHERELTDAQARLKRLEASLQTRTQDQRARQQLETDLARANAKLKDLEQAVSAATRSAQDVSTLRATLQTEQAARQKAEAALQALTQERDAARADRDKTDTEHARLEKIRVEAEQSWRQLDADAAQLRAQLKAREIERQQLADELMTRTKERDAAVEEKAKAAIHDAQQARELADARAKLKELESVVTEKTQAATRAQEQLAALKSARDADATDREAALTAQRAGQDARKNLEDDLAKVRAKLKELEPSASRATQLQHELADLKASIRTEQDARQKAEASLKTQQEAQRKQDAELKQARTHIEELEHTQQERLANDAARRDEAQKAKQQRDAELARAKEDVLSLKTKLDAYLKERDAAQATLRQDLAHAQDVLRDRDHILAQREQEVADLTLERNRALEKLRTASAARRGHEHEQELAQAQRTIQDLQAALQAQTDDATTQQRRLHDDLEEARKARDALSDQIVELHRQLTSLAKDRDETAQTQHTRTQAQLEQDLAVARAALEVKERVLLEQGRAMADSRIEINKHVSDLQARINHDKALFDLAHEQQQRLQAESGQLRAQLKARETERQQLAEELMTRTKERDTARADTAQAAARARELAQAQDRLKELGAALQSRTAERDAARADRDKTDTERARLEKTLAEAEHSRRQLEADTAQLRAQLQDQVGLTNDLTTLRQNMAQHERQLTALQTERDALTGTTTSQAAQMRQLQAALDDAQQQQAHLTEQVTQTQRDAKTRVDEAQQELARLQATVRERTDALAEQEGALSRLRQQLEEQNTARTDALAREFEAELTRVHGEVAQMEAAVRTQQDALANHRVALDELRTQLQQQQVAYAAAQAQAQDALRALAVTRQQLRAPQAVIQPPIVGAAPVPQPPAARVIQPQTTVKRSPDFEKQREAAMDEYVRRQRRALLMEMELRRLINAKGAAQPQAQ